MRFYTLNGHTAAMNRGWTASYNFGESRSRARALARRHRGVDLIATDQYEELRLSCALDRDVTVTFRSVLCSLAAGTESRSNCRVRAAA